MWQSSLLQGQGGDGKQPVVIASKLCARKRPAPIPVRDEVVVTEPELATTGNFRTDCR